MLGQEGEKYVPDEKRSRQPHRPGVTQFSASPGTIQCVCSAWQANRVQTGRLWALQQSRSSEQHGSDLHRCTAPRI